MTNSIKNIYVTILFSSFFMGPAFASLSIVTVCEAKKENILKQIEHAKNYNNMKRAQGLANALYEVSANCTKDGLLEERHQKVSEKQAKVQERSNELEEARATGGEDKIAKKQKKLEEAKDELAEAKHQLTQ